MARKFLIKFSFDHNFAGGAGCGKSSTGKKDLIDWNKCVNLIIHWNWIGWIIYDNDNLY